MIEEVSRRMGYEEIPGHGVKAETEEGTVLAGNAKLMEREGIAYEKMEQPGTVLYVFG